MSSFYDEKELKELNFKSIGKNVLISRKASLYSTNNIAIGDNVRIDDFCILSGNIEIKNYVHISAYTALYGGSKIIIGNYCGCSPRCTIFSQSDDFSGEFMVGPMINEKYTNVKKGNVVLEDYSQLGANTVVLPDVTIKEGAVTGVMSFVNSDLEKWSINVGCPSKKIRNRKMNILELVKEFEKDLNNEK